MDAHTTVILIRSLDCADPTLRNSAFRMPYILNTIATACHRADFALRISAFRATTGLEYTWIATVYDRHPWNHQPRKAWGRFSARRYCADYGLRCSVAQPVTIPDCSFPAKGSELEFNGATFKEGLSIFDRGCNAGRHKAQSVSPHEARQKCWKMFSSPAPLLPGYTRGLPRSRCLS